MITSLFLSLFDWSYFFILLKNIDFFSSTVVLYIDSIQRIGFTPYILSKLFFMLLFVCCTVTLQGGVCVMANYCEICGKGTMSGMNVSHSHLKTKRTWKPNIQRVRAIVDGEAKRVNVCTRCLRSGKVQRNA